MDDFMDHLIIPGYSRISGACGWVDVRFLAHWYVAVTTTLKYLSCKIDYEVENLKLNAIFAWNYTMDPIPLRLTEDLQNRVDALSKELSISRSAVLRLAIQQWLDAAESRGLNPLLLEGAQLKTVQKPMKNAQKK
jgi:hypothetical protein